MHSVQKREATLLMNYLVKLWRQMFDIRAGEHVRTWAMFWYLFSVLMAYYIVKPVSRSMFLTKFDVDKLPSLYIVIAVAGGVFAYLYSRLAAKTLLHTADDVALRDLAMRDVGVHLRPMDDLCPQHLGQFVQHRSLSHRVGW